MALFLAFFDFVKPAANCMKSYYYQESDKVNQVAVVRQRNMLLIVDFSWSCHQGRQITTHSEVPFPCFFNIQRRNLQD